MNAREEYDAWNTLRCLADNAAHNADDDAFKALPYRACLNCRQQVQVSTADVCDSCAGATR